MTDNTKNAKKECHAVYIRDREYIHLTGVDDVMSFDDSGIIMQTRLGVLSLDGEDLKIVSFTSSSDNQSVSSGVQNANDGCGCIIIEGKINGFFYTDDDTPENKKGFFGRFGRK